MLPLLTVSGMLHAIDIIILPGDYALGAPA